VNTFEIKPPVSWHKDIFFGASRQPLLAFLGMKDFLCHQHFDSISESVFSTGKTFEMLATSKVWSTLQEVALAICFSSRLRCDSLYFVYYH
jgi:hypothetical protein